MLQERTGEFGAETRKKERVLLIAGITRKRSSLLLPLAAAALAFGIVWAGVAQGAGSYAASLSGANHTTPVDTTAGGSFSASDTGGALSYTLSSDAEGITQAHIHMAAAGADGPVVAFLFGPVDPGQDGVNASGTISPADLLGPVEGDWDAFIAAVDAGETYVNVHTATNPGGEVRGQIGAAAAGLPATGSGGLADTGNSAWLWALVAAGASFLLVGGSARAVRRLR